MGEYNIMHIGNNISQKSKQRSVKNLTRKKAIFNFRLRDVPGQKSLSQDFCSCPCPGTKGHRENFCPVTKGQRDILSLGNPTGNTLMWCTVKTESD